MFLDSHLIRLKAGEMMSTRFAHLDLEPAVPAGQTAETAVSKTRRLPERSEKAGSPLNSGAKCGKHCSREQRKDENSADGLTVTKKIDEQIGGTKRWL